MSKIMSFTKSIRLRQVLTAFLMGALLLFNTACSGPAQAKVGDAIRTATPDGGTNPAGQNQPYEGGMNNFTDADPSGKAVEGREGKVQRLIDNAKSVRDMKAESPKAVLDGVRNPDPTKELGGNLKGRVQNAKEELKATGDRVVGSGARAADKTQELGNRIQKGANDVKDNISGSVGAGS